jgi:hypothetical protein
LLLPPETANLPINTPSGFQLHEVSFCSIALNYKIIVYLHVDAIAASTCRIHVAGSVGVDTVRKAFGSICEQLPVVQSFTVWGDVEAIDGRRIGQIVLSWECMNAGVRDVDVFEVRAGLC